MFFSTSCMNLRKIGIILFYLAHDGGPYHIGTNTLLYRADQWTGFYMIRTSVMKELMLCVNS